MAKRKLNILQKDALAAHPSRPNKAKKYERPKAAVPIAVQAAAAKRQPTATAAAAAELLQKNTDVADAAKERQQNGPWVPHSPVVRFAAEALAKLLAADESQRSGKTIKTLTLAPHVTAKKATFALTCQTLRYLPVLQKVLAASQLLQKHPKLTPPVAYAMCYEILFGQTFKPSGPAERVMANAKGLLRQRLQEVIKHSGGKTAEDLLPETLKKEAMSRPRAVRVNTLKLSLAEALAWLHAPPPEHAKHAAKGADVQVDPMLPDVLSFPPGTDLHDHPLVADKRLILQSRSSCMAAHALRPRPGVHVVDCCAAPGNKTTHLAALMGGKGRIDAFELDPKRAGHLQRNLDACGATNVTVHQGDFLQTDPDAAEWADVEAMLLDPSCSGSGTTASRMDFLLPSQWQQPHRTEEDREVQRLKRLAAFQEAALRHALRFPALRRIVYSTCSVHTEENEAVVGAVLPAAKAAGFRLKDPFPDWQRRGQPLFKGAERLVRVNPEEDGTDGFFIALFDRDSAAAAEKPAAAEQAANKTAGTKAAQNKASTAEATAPGSAAVKLGKASKGARKRQQAAEIRV